MNRKFLLTITATVVAASFGVRAFQTPAAPVLPPAAPPAPIYSKLPGNIWPPVMKAGKTSPALTPEQEMKTFSMPPGYRIELVAAEPMIESPIVMDFDADGRLWVLETPGFLPDMTGRDSPDPINRVVVLEDTDNDGKMDKRTVFADKLGLARALKVLDHGVLVGEPPNLWLMKDTNGDLKMDTKESVVDTYGAANRGIEHNANGTMWGMDNVMHSSEHTFNVRYKNGKFESQPTLSRGQWQGSQDDAGRFYRNVNDAPLFVDYTAAKYFMRNPNAPRTRGLYESLIDQIDATVYPVRNTRGVNRGYRDEYHRPDGSAIVIQGAGTPTIYRGDKYPAAVRGTAFISDSPTNLVHQLTLVDDGSGRLSAKNTWPRGEFLASSDERFRPVNLMSAPDGNMYILDMYRGVVQAGGIWSEYLTQYIKEHEMQLPTGKGRIWRMVYGTGPNVRGPKPALSSATPAQLVQTLTHANGWWRDTAQRLLVERGDKSAVPALEAMAAAPGANWRPRLHAIWTLDGMDAITPAVVTKALADPSPEVRAGAVRISERWLGEAGNPLIAAVAKLAADPNWNVRRQVGASLGEMAGPARADTAVAILLKDGADPISTDAVLTSLKDIESEVLTRVLQAKGATPATQPTEAIAMLAAAVAKAGDAASVQKAIDAATDAAQPMWQRRAILQGLDAGLPAPGAGGGGGRGGRGGGGGGGGGGNNVGTPGLSTPGARPTATPGRGVTLASEPTALTKLAAGTDPLAGAAKPVANKVNWTGKPAPPPAPPVTPLTADEQKRFEAGKVVFMGLCAGCHNEDGQGKDKLGPNLVTSKYVQAAVAFPIRILTQGKEGPIGLMPPVTGMLTDEQIAAVLTYIRREWGHTASAVTTVDVRETRQSTTHKGPWTEAELSQMLAGGGRGRGGGN